ncbi:MAG: PASTA domain-containing protein [Myxococcales bacterium]|nr:PASTA domain-containing protein [Myxococcales bacterium]
MKVVATVRDEDGGLLARAAVTAVEARTNGPREIAEGRISQGKLSVSFETNSAWGLLIEGRPVLIAPRVATARSVDLGELVLRKQGLPVPVFHASDGLVFGVPAELHVHLQAAQRRSMGDGARAAATGDPTADAVASTERIQMSFGDALGSTTRQLHEATVADTNFTLASVTVNLKGIPTASDNSIGLEFPDAELIKSGAALSELTFNVSPRAQATEPAAASGPALPDLTGYTPELAQRKAAALALTTELHAEVVSDARRAGVVVRQLPVAGSIADPDNLLRLYVGKLKVT